jgi:hypothetical protein
MKTMLRGAAALALVAGLVSTTARADADVDVPAYLSIDVVVQGTPPPGTTITLIDAVGIGMDPGLFPVALDELGPGPEVADVVVDGIFHGVYVDPSDDGDADAVDYSCATSGVDGATPNALTSCAELAPNPPLNPVLYAGTSFFGQEPETVAERSDITVTLTFDPPCDGQEVTVNLNRGHVPTSGADVILGTPFDETINGLGGADRICGGGGRDTLRGGLGRDRLLGGVGPDRLEGGNDGDTLLGGAGVDTLLGQAGADALNGGPQRDTCNGGPQRDTGSACEVRSSIP